MWISSSIFSLNEATGYITKIHLFTSIPPALQPVLSLLIFFIDTSQGWLGWLPVLLTLIVEQIYVANPHYSNVLRQQHLCITLGMTLTPPPASQLQNSRQFVLVVFLRLLFTLNLLLLPTFFLLFQLVFDFLGPCNPDLKRMALPCR